MGVIPGRLDSGGNSGVVMVGAGAHGGHLML